MKDWPKPEDLRIDYSRFNWPLNYGDGSSLADPCDDLDWRLVRWLMQEVRRVAHEKRLSAGEAYASVTYSPSYVRIPHNKEPRT
jgi:hypothetical protein